MNFPREGCVEDHLSSGSRRLGAGLDRKQRQRARKASFARQPTRHCQAKKRVRAVPSLSLAAARPADTTGYSQVPVRVMVRMMMMIESGQAGRSPTTKWDDEIS